jgi:2-methylisocitrate lyase-like PEP mutase family enzyme
MERMTTHLRRLIEAEDYIYMPVAFDGLGGRLVQKHGFKAVCSAGYTTGSSLCIAEPLLTMTEQIAFAKAIVDQVDLPLIMDAGAGWGEPLHTMRTVRECIRAGIAGAHFEDQLFPKRAHYHKYVAHAIPADEFIAKIKMACVERDRIDKDFVVIARTDTCRFEGLDEAVRRINAAADVGADLGLVFPRNDDEAVRAPKECKVPLVYVISRGNRDGRPMYTNQQLADMGYKIGLDAQILLMTAFHFSDIALAELAQKGEYTGITWEDCVARRQEIEDLIGLEAYYEIEEQTVEKMNWGKQ